MDDIADITKYMVPMMGMIMMMGVMQMVIPQPTQPTQPTEPEPPPPPEPEPEPPPPEPTRFKCPYCDLYFSTLSEIPGHVASAHPDEPPFIEVDIDWGQ